MPGVEGRLNLIITNSQIFQIDMKTDKHKLQAALVRSFFDAFSSGVIDCGQGSVQERRQPQNVKRAMLDYYEQIAPAFFETVFFPLAVIHSG